MDYRIVLSRSARSDIRNIVRYISFDDSAQALRFGRLLILQTRGLSQFPERGRIVPEFGDESIREIIVGAYRIVYRLSHDPRLIEIIRFWHARRGVPVMPE